LISMRSLGSSTTGELFQFSRKLKVLRPGKELWGVKTGLLNSASNSCLVGNMFVKNTLLLYL